MLAVAALLLRTAVLQEDPLLVLPAGVVALAALWMLGVVAPRRATRSRAAAESAGPAADPAAARWAVGLVVLTAVTALVVDVSGRA